MRAMSLVFAGITTACFAAVADEAAPKPKQNVTGKTIVYYFHRTARCPSCEKIEALTKKVVEDTFPSELEDGAIEWKSVNVDQPQDAHYEEDYQLQWQSVVLSQTVNGKQAQWKNLEKIWELLDNEAAFKAYIVKEIRAFRNEKQKEGGEKK